MSKPIVILCLLFLAACSGVAPLHDNLAEDKAALAAFATDDLEAALADAEAHNDIVASTCYGALLDKIPELQARTGGEVKGAFSAFQKARNVRRAVDAGISDEVHLACAALASDTRGTIGRIARLVGVPLP